MPRFYFNVEDERSFAAGQGVELPDLDAARLEAVRRSSTMLRDSPATFWGGGEWKLIVSDENGMILFVLQFAAVASPAAERSHTTLGTS